VHSAFVGYGIFAEGGEQFGDIALIEVFVEGIAGRILLPLVLGERSNLLRALLPVEPRGMYRS
jgi:hypothetical protein